MSRLVGWFLLCWLLLGSPMQPLSAAEKDPWGQDIPVLPWVGERGPMRMRVVADYPAEIAWRLPYSLLPRDQLTAVYSRVRPRTVWISTGVSSDGRPSVSEDSVLEWEAEPSARLVSETLASPPTELATVGDRLAGATLTWRPYDYYAVSATRPFAAKAWAPAGITALIGEGAGRRALVVLHGLHCSVAVISGAMVDKVELLDQLQVMVPNRTKRLQTWAEAQGDKGVATGPTGKPVKSASGVVAWKDGYEFETRHYHLTGHSSPARLAYHAANLEALYATYADFFGTGEGSPLKFEVHIANTWQDFTELSIACGRQLTVPKGSVLGGFFVPLTQSLWVYEESGTLGGPSMEIEHVMCHECSHQFLHMACNGSDNVPTWVNEGVAVHFENGTLVNGRYKHRPPRDRIQQLAALYKEKGTTLSPMSAYLDHHGKITAEGYGEVYAMVHFWAFGTPGGHERFIAYWAALRKGEDGLTAFERIFLVDMAASTGSRQQALDNWRAQLTTYVLRDLIKL